MESEGRYWGKDFFLEKKKPFPQTPIPEKPIGDNLSYFSVIGEIEANGASISRFSGKTFFFIKKVRPRRLPP